MRVYRIPKGVTLVVGPWHSVVSWATSARFGNGSRWFSGWHRWEDDA